jgi:hypothetical protein
MKYKTINELRAAFLKEHPQVQRKPKGDYSTDIRCAFDLWVEELEQNGLVSSELASKATL